MLASIHGSMPSPSIHPLQQAFKFDIPQAQRDEVACCLGARIADKSTLL